MHFILWECAEYHCGGGSGMWFRRGGVGEGHGVGWVWLRGWCVLPVIQDRDVYARLLLNVVSPSFACPHDFGGLGQRVPFQCGGGRSVLFSYS